MSPKIILLHFLSYIMLKLFIYFFHNMNSYALYYDREEPGGEERGKEENASSLMERLKNNPGTEIGLIQNQYGFAEYHIEFQMSQHRTSSAPFQEGPITLVTA